MNIKLSIVLGVLLLISLSSWSQNTLQINYSEVNFEENVDVVLSLNNSEPISALQFDISYNTDALELITGHLLTSRGANHTFGVSSSSSGVIRVIIYSMNNANFANSSGDLVKLKLKALTLPGNWDLQISNLVASSASGANIEINGQTGTVTVLGPFFKIEEDTLFFGRVPLNSDNYVDVFKITNAGTSTLILSSANDITPFSVINTFPINIDPFSELDIVIGIDASEIGTKSVNLIFQNNDPDSQRNINSTNLKAEIYIANDLVVGNASGGSNVEIEIPVAINNSQVFTGFQFDVLLQEGIYYVNNSIITTDRATDHSISANTIYGNLGVDTLRIIGYSLSNANFLGNNGNVFSFKIISTLLGGFHVLEVQNVILTNSSQENIISDVTYGSVTINEPKLDISESILDFGTVSFIETAEKTFQIYNTGVVALSISSVNTNTDDLSFDLSFPWEIEAGSFKEVTISFQPSSKGEFLDTLVFVDNDPSEHIQVTLQASVYMPNYLKVENEQYEIGEDVWVDILVDNFEDFVALQFDLSFPSEKFTCVTEEAVLTSRLADHNLVVVEIQTGKIRVLIYSLDQATVVGETGSVLRLKFTQNSNTEGVFDFTLSKYLISNSSSENILYGIENGEVEIIAPVGIENNDFESNFSIYPNPTSDKIRIEQGDNPLLIQKILLFDSNGTLLVTIPSQDLNNSTIVISCHQFSQGIYYLKIYTEKGNISRKISIVY